MATGDSLAVDWGRGAADRLVLAAAKPAAVVAGRLEAVKDGGFGLHCGNGAAGVEGENGVDAGVRTAAAVPERATAQCGVDGSGGAALLEFAGERRLESRRGGRLATDLKGERGAGDVDARGGAATWAARAAMAVAGPGWRLGMTGGAHGSHLSA
uniref:DUF834 domain-containing protein n=1 Tax=Oryza sativa subsp. japonica TaxID=39947 RepID=Q6ZF44_ORYSJ|nr:hypothetical protein [Oryza sativa Japonica Group]